MALPLDQVIGNIACDADGVWRATTHSAVSYPEAGHDTIHDVEADSFWFAHRNRCIAAAIAHAPPDRSLPFADVGGGNGFVAAMIRGLGYRVVLIEPGASGIAHARERGLDELVQASLVDLDMVPGQLGAIGLFDVLEHIEDDAGALRRMHPMLAAGGRLYLTVPAHRWLWSSADVRAGHYRRYTTAQLRALFDRCGYDVDLCSYYFRPLPLPMLLLRCLPERLGLRRGGARPPARVAAEHRRKGTLLQRLLGPEERAIATGHALAFGASCLLVATRRGDRP
jgi:SAM-dependent methyltransferase